MNKYLGLRTFKTAIALVIALFISKIFKLEYPYFVAMTAIISMDKTAIDSTKMWRNRTVGTLLGATIGICLSYIDRGNPILCGFGFIILSMIMNKLTFYGAIPVSGFVMVAIMVHTTGSPFHYGFNRTLDTLIGGGVAFLVNIFILPYYYTNKIDKNLDKLWEYTHNLINKVKNKEDLSYEAETINDELVKMVNSFNFYTKEIFFKKHDDTANKCHKHVNMLKKISNHLILMEEAKKENSDVYNYHNSKIIDIYEEYLKTL